MIKRLFLILIVAITLFGINDTNYSSVHNKDKTITSKSHLVSNLPLNKINSFNFVTEIEDDFNEDKFQISLNYSYVANYCKQKIQYRDLKLASINSRICCTNLYSDVPFYMAFRNYRI